jgi:hypothetical protein
MSLLNKLADAPGFAKIGLQGPQGSGKSFTALEIAVAIHKLFKSKKPIAFFDTESGSDYLTTKAKEATGLDMLRVKTRAFSQLMEVVRECEAGASDILIVDSITHVWRELQESYLARVNEGRQWKKQRMDIGDIMEIKKLWYPWPDLYLNSRVHILVCGREGNEWGHEEDEETGKKELVAVGKKMKVEGEFGYESSLILGMSMLQTQAITVRNKKKKTATEKPRTIINVATVLKDRFDVMNGVVFQFPSGKDFMPFLEKLNPPAHVGVNTEDTSTETLPEYDAGYMRAKTDKEIMLEKIQAEFQRGWPGQTAVEKKARGDAMEEFFQTRSWTEIEKRMSLPALAGGYTRLRAAVDALESVRAEALKEQQQPLEAAGGAAEATENGNGGKPPRKPRGNKASPEVTAAIAAQAPLEESAPAS